MKKFYVNIMINGTDDIFVIGNDFINACNDQHRVGENKLVIENPNAQKYNGNLERLHILSSEQLSMLLFNFESGEEVTVSDATLLLRN